jgi:curved DNA-binding protein
MIRLRGKGMPVYKEPRMAGDLIVTLKTRLPQLSERQKELLRRVREE